MSAIWCARPRRAARRWCWWPCPELSLLGALTQRPSDAALYRELGDEEKVPVIASVFADTLANPEWRADQIHPNAEGYRHMAAGIESALRQSGLL